MIRLWCGRYLEDWVAIMDLGKQHGFLGPFLPDDTLSALRMTFSAKPSDPPITTLLLLATARSPLFGVDLCTKCAEAARHTSNNRCSKPFRGKVIVRDIYKSLCSADSESLASLSNLSQILYSVFVEKQ